MRGLHPSVQLGQIEKQNLYMVSRKQCSLFWYQPVSYTHLRAHETSLHLVCRLLLEKKLRRVRGGAEAIAPPQFTGLAGRTFAVNETLRIDDKQAIAQAAAALCDDGDSIIINGGTTTFQMVHPLVFRRLAILTNSFPLAEHLLKHSKNTITLSGGTIYREQNILLSPFENDITRNFHAKYMFIGAQGISPLGLVEADPLVIQAEQKLIRQADELVVLADSSKFDKRSSLIICELSKISTIITDYKISDKAASMLDAADVNLIVTRSGENQYEGEAAS